MPKLSIYNEETIESYGWPVRKFSFENIGDTSMLLIVEFENGTALKLEATLGGYCDIVRGDIRFDEEPVNG